MVKEKTFVFFCLCFFHLVGVFADELKSVSVKEGDSVTLQTDLTELQTGDRIKWKFGANGSLIAKIFALTIDIPVNLTERFRDRLKLDIKTGSLTITDITTEHAGVYEVEISISRSSSYKHIFNVTVYAAPTTTTPTTTPTTPKLPSASKSSSGQTPSDHSGSDFDPVPILAASAGFLLIVAALVIFFIYRKHRKTDQQVKAREEEVTYADTTFVKRKAPSVKQEEDVVYAETVKAREEEVTYADTTFVKRKAPSVKQEEDVVYAGIVARR
ncbi:CMRF35-like molecule 1 isoform X2 [Megalobrama amblycephala]|uniref:CMRF35-like molecule 1 isoform X2 n=1 Tax=Megalobrama amblycephala TaxID=75352 RepID=UPI002013FA1D|nr:CMRF35-like molecule 1 isoform X2 [Megalobrama amblycephala]